jgi:hypothetical protein
LELVNGVDIIKWDASGKIVEFKVMIRPLKAINLIHERMAAVLAAGNRPKWRLAPCVGAVRDIFGGQLGGCPAFDLPCTPYVALGNCRCGRRSAGRYRNKIGRRGAKLRQAPHLHQA